MKNTKYIVYSQPPYADISTYDHVDHYVQLLVSSSVLIWASPRVISNTNFLKQRFVKSV